MIFEKQLSLVVFNPGRRQAQLRLALDVLGLDFHTVRGEKWLASRYLDDLVAPEPTIIVFEEGASPPDQMATMLAGQANAAFLVADPSGELAGLAERYDIPLYTHKLDEFGLVLWVTQLLGRWHQTHKRDWGTDILQSVAGANIVAGSAAMNEALKLVNKIAIVDAGVYISGETGTGKELIARAIHYMSERCDDPFIAVNCGAFTDELLLSELFGHEKGAFTGADRTHIGLIERANGGTLFLDEIDTLSPKAQVVLLRYLQEQEYRPVGGDNLRTTNIRVIAASNADVAELVMRNEFRQDLWFRLDILRVDLPPLRVRKGDIFLLSQFFLKQIAEKYQKPIKVLHSDTVNWMERYAWPGNVRELENFLHRAYLLAESDLLNIPPKGELSELEYEPVLHTFQAEKLRRIQEFERDYLERVLRESGGNISRAARTADKERRTFTRLMEKYKIRRGQFLRGKTPSK